MANCKKCGARLPSAATLTPVRSAVCQRCARGWASLRASLVASARLAARPARYLGRQLRRAGRWLVERADRLRRNAGAALLQRWPRRGPLARWLPPLARRPGARLSPRPQVLAFYRHLIEQARAGRRRHPEFDLANGGS